MEFDAITVVNTILLVGIVFMLASIPALNRNLRELREKNAAERKKFCEEFHLSESVAKETHEDGSANDGGRGSAKATERHTGKG